MVMIVKGHEKKSRGFISVTQITVYQQILMRPIWVSGSGRVLGPRPAREPSWAGDLDGQLAAAGAGCCPPPRRRVPRARTFALLAQASEQ